MIIESRIIRYRDIHNDITKPNQQNVAVINVN